MPDLYQISSEFCPIHIWTSDGNFLREPFSNSDIKFSNSDVRIFLREVAYEIHAFRLGKIKDNGRSFIIDARNSLSNGYRSRHSLVRRDDGAPGAESDALRHAAPAAETDADPSTEDRWADVEPIEEPEGNGRPGPPALEKVSSIKSDKTNGAPASGAGPDESEMGLSEKLPAESPLPSGG